MKICGALATVADVMCAIPLQIFCLARAIRAECHSNFRDLFWVFRALAVFPFTVEYK